MDSLDTTGNYQLSLFTHQKAKYEWMPVHHTAFLTLKNAVTQAPILCYPDATKLNTVFTDTSDNACGTQLSQEHDGMEFQVAILSHTFTYTQKKWSTTEQEAYKVYYAVTKWNYYLQGAKIIFHNDHKTLARFLNGKNANNKMNRWGLEFTTYIITFKWILGAQNKAADYLSRLVELPHDRQATAQMLTATNHDGPTFSTRNRVLQCNITENLTPQPKVDTVTPNITTITDTPDVTWKPLTEDRVHTLLQMQKTDPFFKCISKHLSNGKPPKHESNFFLHIKGLLYKHIMDSNQKFLALVIPKTWKYIVLIEAHDKLGHQGAIHTYCLIKHQYYWQGMNKNIRKYIANCTLCCREKAKVQSYPLQMTEIPE